MALGQAIDVVGDIAKLDGSLLLSTIAGGMLAGVFAVLLQRLATAALGVVTRGRLQELTDVDQELLRKMARDAPGSWQHARAMANLAEGAAAAIGADALLTRVGAYYHDLGKTIQPKYFVENLVPGEPSPHSELEPDVSADAIMAHVVEGARILREGGIPEPVVEFAYTHHGTSVIEYFWHKYLEAGNPKGLSDAAFRYPGMRPRTKETAILMLVDAIEAAARTVDEPSREKFEGVVQRVMNVKLRQGQLDECGLTMEDLRVIQSTLIDTLCNVYHNRIKYPWQDKEEEGEAPLPVPGVATEQDVARERSRETS
jgi:putative nucleotidyltransferase with HDIG domain